MTQHKTSFSTMMTVMKGKFTWRLYLCLPCQSQCCYKRYQAQHYNALAAFTLVCDQGDTRNVYSSNLQQPQVRCQNYSRGGYWSCCTTKKNCQVAKDLAWLKNKEQITHDYEASTSRPATKCMKTTEYSDVEWCWNELSFGTLCW